MTVEGYINVQSNASLVLAVKSNKLYLSDKKSVDHKEQRWNFVLPVFKKKSGTVFGTNTITQRLTDCTYKGSGTRAVTTTTTTKTKVVSYRYAQYPSGWFFIRSLVAKSTKESPIVLTADEKSSTVTMTALNKEHWQAQLWTYSAGVLVNYSTKLAIDVKCMCLFVFFRLKESDWY